LGISIANGAKVREDFQNVSHANGIIAVDVAKASHYKSKNTCSIVLG